MSVEPIRKHVMPVRQAIAGLEAEADKISGMIVLVCTNNDEDYDYYVAGTIGAERAVGRLEIIKRAILDKVMLKALVPDLVSPALPVSGHRRSFGASVHRWRSLQLGQFDEVAMCMLPYPPRTPEGAEIRGC